MSPDHHARADHAEHADHSVHADHFVHADHAHADAGRAEAAWHLVVPVKARHLAKTRLHPPAGIHRADLAAAFALDTLDVVAQLLSPGHLVVVTSDPATRQLARRLEAVVVDDGGDGLNSAVRQGLRAVAESGDGPTGVLLGDLPALTPADLATALEHCARLTRAMVPDAEGTGTVLLTAQRAGDMVPRFGPGSAAAHEVHGHRRLALDLPGLRTDVDDDVALEAAQALGVGAHTRAVLDRLPVEARACGPVGR